MARYVQKKILLKRQKKKRKKTNYKIIFIQYLHEWINESMDAWKGKWLIDCRHRCMHDWKHGNSKIKRQKKSTYCYIKILYTLQIINKGKLKKKNFNLN